ncbi:unnamed protein product, partial [Rotaria sp. Silwood1]
FFDITDCQDDQENILLPLRLLLSQYSSFSVEINEIDSFIENHISFMKLNEQSTKYVKQLHEQLKQLFPQCLKNNRNSYNPHMTIAQFDNQEKLNEVKSSLSKLLEKKTVNSKNSIEISFNTLKNKQCAISSVTILKFIVLAYSKSKFYYILLKNIDI